MSIAKVLPIALLFNLSVQGIALASACESRSAASRVQLVELYTSEGCSSCPPADKWLRALVPNVLAAGEVVPLAFHVDYWDRLGWRDRFASPVYTNRQSEYSKVSGSSFIFTPQVIVAGRNYKSWSDNGRVQGDVRKALKTLPEADLVLRQEAVSSGKLGFEIQTKLRPDVKAGDVRLYAALFQNGLVSDVGRGENSGSRLLHDYVVRSLSVSNAIDSSGKMTFKNSFTLPEDAQTGMMGVAVFAQDSKTGTVLQAMAAPLCVSKK